MCTMMFIRVPLCSYMYHDFHLCTKMFIGLHLFLLLQVLDRPDSKPEFLKPYYEKYLPENAASGLTVVMVEVKKPDDPNAVIRFRLDNKAKSYFKINETSGLITTAGDVLDWEVTPVITFPVYAFDIKRPALTGQTFVRVVVSIFIHLYPSLYISTKTC